MHLLVVRHGIAEGRKASARTNRDDAARRLTTDGRRKMKNGALGLRQLVPEVDLLASSPLRRAADTADIIAAWTGSLHGCNVNARVAQSRWSATSPIFH